jgi:hypothetical protein
VRSPMARISDVAENIYTALLVVVILALVGFSTATVLRLYRGQG